MRSPEQDASLARPERGPVWRVLGGAIALLVVGGLVLGLRDTLSSGLPSAGVGRPDAAVRQGEPPAPPAILPGEISIGSSDSVDWFRRFRVRLPADPSAVVIVEASALGRTLCVQTYLPGITRIHVHRGMFGELVLTHSTVAGEPGGVGPLPRCARDLDESMLRDIIEHPEDHYVELHGPGVTANLVGELAPEADGTGIVCDFPPMRPAYLPWLERAAPVPEPRRDFLFEPGRGRWAMLVWSNGPYRVAFGRMSSGAGGGRPTPVVLQGVQGRIFPLNPTYSYLAARDGDVAIQWPTGSPACNSFVLELATSGALDHEGARTEILKIARSLRRHDG